MLIDVHVHLAGNGRTGSGCRLPSGGPVQRVTLPIMLRRLGLDQAALEDDLDRIYFERLREHAAGAGLDAAVLLACDRVHDDTGRPLDVPGMPYVPNDHALRLAKEHPGFLAGVSIHPARPDALDELERCLEGGAALLKLLPNCHNVDCGRPAYRKFWERMAGAGLPFLAHTGGELLLPSLRPELADPRRLIAPLECGVTVIAAHCGTRATPFDRDYFEVFREMLPAHPNLYGDLSAMNHPLRSERLRDCFAPDVLPRLVHGSDYPVPVYASAARWRRLVDHETARAAAACGNPLLADLLLKRAIGFPEEVFSRAAGLLRGVGV